MRTITRYYHTLKHLKPVQIYGRIFSKIKRPLTSIAIPVFKPIKVAQKNKIQFIKHSPQNNSDKIIKNEFTFLNQTHSFVQQINWQNKELPLLWMFNLHYFDYLSHLNEEEKKRLIFDWIEKNPMGTLPGWHPYTLSLRIVNWIKWAPLENTIQKSLFNQCAYLYRNLEYYHPANHYLENAKAMVLAGISFQDLNVSRQWLSKGLSIYKKYLPKMVLEDGCFFELSPMYHSIILAGLLDILNVIDINSDDFLLLKSYAEKMLGHLEKVTHPDGEIALINDSTTEIALMPKELIHYANGLGINASELGNNKSKILTYRNSNLFFVMKRSDIGPNNIPAHSHADIFSYELSYKGKRFIVDSGNYNYENDEMRNYCRSTAAHNTVAIDGKDQADMWGAFRVARRYSAKDIFSMKDSEGFTFSGIFDGYSKIIGDNLVHRRTIEVRKAFSQITIKDEINGNRNHLVESYIHLHPDVKINKTEDDLILLKDDVQIKLRTINSEFSIIDGWYCPEFGKRIKNKIIKIFSNHTPAMIIYSFILE